ncbi:MAG: DUF1819 family protein [Chloroflexi bacterium]|nr:DUF1819 family protein [Chloroflexota bacterium]
MADRAAVVSSFTLIKGTMIEETYEVFARWDFTVSKRENLGRLRDQNYIGAASGTWLRDVAKVLNRRYDPATRDRALVVLAKGGCPFEEWRPIALWHMTRDEFLLRDFLQGWLFSAYDDGAYRIRPDELDDYLRSVGERGGIVEHQWSDATRDRVAGGLLKAAANFGLLHGLVAKEFATYHLPERSFLYLLHAMRDTGLAPRKVITSPDWRMYLMRPPDVEHEILRLHQFHRLRYEVAGSIAELDLPRRTALEYAESMVA